MSIHTPYGKEWINIIAQDDDDDYQESGWAAFEVDDKYYLMPYSHCSCWGTWDDIYSREDLKDMESYTKEQLINIAKNEYDPAWTERDLSKEDYNYDHLMRVYEQILNYFAVGG